MYLQLGSKDQAHSTVPYAYLKLYRVMLQEEKECRRRNCKTQDDTKFHNFRNEAQGKQLRIMRELLALCSSLSLEFSHLKNSIGGNVRRKELKGEKRSEEHRKGGKKSKCNKGKGNKNFSGNKK